MALKRKLSNILQLVLKTNIHIRNIASEEVTSCGFVQNLSFSCVHIHICACLFIYTQIYGDSTLPLDNQDTRYTALWVSLYRNSSIQLFWLRRKPQKYTSLCPLTGITRQNYMWTWFLRRKLRSSSSIWPSCLFVPCSSLKRIYHFQSLNVTPLFLYCAPW